MGALSLVFAAVALNWRGVLIVVVVVLFLFGIELYREASRLDSQQKDLESVAATARDEKAVLVQLEEKNQDLERAVSELRDNNRTTTIGLEGLLGNLAAQLEYVRLTKNHRLLLQEVGNAPVTRFEVNGEGGEVAVSAASNQAALLEGELVALVQTETMTDVAVGPVVETTVQGLKAIFDIAFLPVELVDDLIAQGAISPSGYVLQPAGIFIKNYGKMRNDQLDELESALVTSRDAVSGALTNPAMSNHEKDPELEDQRMAASDALEAQAMETKND